MDDTKFKIEYGVTIYISQELIKLYFRHPNVDMVLPELYKSLKAELVERDIINPYLILITGNFNILNKEHIKSSILKVLQDFVNGKVKEGYMLKVIVETNGESIEKETFQLSWHCECGGNVFVHLNEEWNQCVNCGIQYHVQK